MSYGETVREAFRITWRNPYLWFFGFFAGGSLGSGFNVPSGGGFGGDEASSFAGRVLSGNEVALILGLVLLGLLLFLAFLVLTVISNGGLAASVAAIDRGNERRFSSTWRAGLSVFWRVVGYFILFFLLGVALLVSIVLPLGLLVAGVFVSTESGSARILTSVFAVFAGILLVIVTLIPLFIISQFALRGIAVDGKGVFASLGDGFRLFRREVGKSLLVWLIWVGLSIGTGLALALAALIFGFLLFLPTMVLAATEYTTAAVATGAVAALILVPLLIVAAAAVNTFLHSYWTLVYLRLVSPEGTSPGTGV